MNLFNFRKNLYYVFWCSVDGDGHEQLVFSGAYTTEAKAVKSLPEGATIYRDEVPSWVFEDLRWIRYGEDQGDNYLIFCAPVDTEIDPTDRIIETTMADFLKRCQHTVNECISIQPTLAMNPTEFQGFLNSCKNLKPFEPFDSTNS